MKAFAFRLEQVLRWRETQVNLQKARLAGAAGKLAEIEAKLRGLQTELQAAASQLIDAARGDVTGLGLDTYAGFRRRSNGHIRGLEAQAVAARKIVEVETRQLIDVNRKLRAIENLKHAELGEWRRQFDRELAAFTDEAFLQGLRKTAAHRRGR
ncbi:MAG TPA: flagellar FliJ family protein [Bryobacteraceae bacterium]|nr:flagellar FliJ family protein [Bryobacteraceae bacterium]